MRFRSKPTELEAVQWTGTADSAAELLAFTHDTNGYRRLVVFRAVNTGGDMALHLYHNDMNAYLPVPVGWYVAKGNHGNYYRIHPHTVEDKWEPIDVSDAEITPAPPVFPVFNA